MAARFFMSKPLKVAYELPIRNYSSFGRVSYVTAERVSVIYRN